MTALHPSPAVGGTRQNNCSGRKSYLSLKLLQAWIGLERFPYWIDVEPRNLPVPFSGRAAEAIQGLVILSQTSVHSGTNYRRYVLPLTNFMQRGQNVLGLFPLSGPRVDKSQAHIPPDAVTDLCSVTK